MTIRDTYLKPHEKSALRLLAAQMGGMREMALALSLSPTSLYRYLRGDIRLAWETRARCNAKLARLGLGLPFDTQETAEWLGATSSEGE